jgi:hypothetical protein
MRPMRVKAVTEWAEPRCPYCIGVETVSFYEDVTLDESLRPVRLIFRTITQREHDRACPASSAPLGSALSAHDMTAEMIADARRQRSIA